jgi:hypothetical protein
MLQFLTEPYPSTRSLRTDLLFSLGVGFFVGWFLVTFQPGDTYTWQDPNKKLFLWGYSVVVFVFMLLTRAAIPAIFPKVFREESWTVGKHIIYVLISFVITILACFYYNMWFFEMTFRWRNLFSFTLISSTIAVFPLSILVMMDYIRRLKKYQAGAQKVELHPSSATEQLTIPPMALKDEQGQVQLELRLDTILYLQSAANYVEIIYLQEDQIKKELLRNTLKAVAAQLPDDQFLRVHRSFLVQLDKVEAVTGNAQGYKLHFTQDIAPIPVSRSRSQATLAALEA